MEDAAVLSRSALKVLRAFNASKSDGQCTRGCTLSDKIHWWGAGIGDAGCRAFGRILEAKSGTSKRTGPVAALHNLLLGRNELGDGCMDVLVGLAARGFFQNLRALGLSRKQDYGPRMQGAWAINRGWWLTQSARSIPFGESRPHRRLLRDTRPIARHAACSS